ncbi:MAG TPA: hypothetical protein VLH75_20110 [Longimicrobiales bacterium]|nr:hypothetical protein [Longimicrobiales bacterium]
MSGFIVRGLIELITNGRDSGRRMMDRGEITLEGLLNTPIELLKNVGGDGRAEFVVRDHFEGMTADVMREHLLSYGKLSSGYESSRGVRGLNARGAKDVGILGEVRFESICDGGLASCRVSLGRYTEPESGKATDEDRARLSLFEGNGTVVTFTPFPEITIPRFETLASDLERHVEVRYAPPGLGAVPLDVFESNPNGGVKERRVLGFAPESEVVIDREVTIPGYEHLAGRVRVQLSRAHDALKVGGRAITRLWRSEAGVVVADGRTAHDVTYFGAAGSGEAGAAHLVGLVEAPQIALLLGDFEAFELRRSQDGSVAPDPRNPMQVTDPDRQGLNQEHPFVVALTEVVRPLVEEALAVIEDAIRPSTQHRVGDALRRVLEKLGEELAEKLEVEAGEPDPGRSLPLGLSVVPPHLRVVIDKTRKAGVYYKAAEQLTEPMECTVSTESGAIELMTTQVTLEPIQESGFLRGYVEVKGAALSDAAFVDVVMGGDRAGLRVSVRDEQDPGEPILHQDLQFSRGRYTSVPGRQKNIEIFGDLSLDGEAVSVTVSGSDIRLSHKSVVLAFDPELGVCTGVLRAQCEHEANEKLVAACRDLGDTARIVFRELKGKPRIKFDLVDEENFRGVRRFKWEASKNEVLIAAKHPTLRRVLGPDSDPSTGEKWPGQDGPQARAILAEVIAEAFVDRMMQRELENLAIGVDSLVDPVEYEDLRYSHFDEVLQLCHKALTPAYSK